MMREKLTDLFDASAQAVLHTLSARETVSSFQKALNEATGDFSFAQAAQREIAEERNLVTSEIGKLRELVRCGYMESPWDSKPGSNVAFANRLELVRA